MLANSLPHLLPSYSRARYGYVCVGVCVDGCMEVMSSQVCPLHENWWIMSGKWLMQWYVRETRETYKGSLAGQTLTLSGESLVRYSATDCSG